MAIFVMFLVEVFVMRYGKANKRHPADAEQECDVEDDRATSRHVGMAENEDLDRYYGAQISGILILEFGVIFHSVFIGLTLAVSGAEFTTLYIVIVFHRTFEGLGLGARLAIAKWPKTKTFTPYLLAVAYGVTTPITIGIGLALRAAYPPTAETTLLVNGIFDSISAGILIYVGCIELLAQELVAGSVMLDASVPTMLYALILMSLGAGLMALLGKWA